MEAGGGGTNQNSLWVGGKSNAGRSKGGGQQSKSDGCAANEAAYASTDVSPISKGGNVETCWGGGESGEGGGVEREKREKLRGGELSTVIRALNGFDRAENLRMKA